MRQPSVTAALNVLNHFFWPLAQRKHARVAVTRAPLLRKMTVRTDFDDVYVCYAFIAIETPVGGPQYTVSVPGLDKSPFLTDPEKYAHLGGMGQSCFVLLLNGP